MYISIALKKGYPSVIGVSPSLYTASECFNTWFKNNPSLMTEPRIQVENFTKLVPPNSTVTDVLKNIQFITCDTEWYSYNDSTTTIEVLLLIVKCVAVEPVKLQYDHQWKDGFVIEWTEFEAGWGSRPDGVSFHTTRESIVELNNRYGTGIPKAEVPECYSVHGVPKPVKIHVDLFEQYKLAQYFWFDKNEHVCHTRNGFLHVEKKERENV